MSEQSLDTMLAADIVLLGEVHDNPAHHATQAQLVRRVAPKALVFEMLTPEQAARITPELVPQKEALEDILGWAESGWPDFAMYHPVFLAASEAAFFGAAVPRNQARASIERGVAAAFGAEAAQFGLTEPLSEEEQARRETLQFDAHCAALPEDLLPAMVDIQRLRDARLAQEALRAFQDTGGPVVIITGNGHARADWGAPWFLRRAAGGELRLFALGQSEDGNALPGAFDAVIDAQAVDRPDPCAAFQN